MNDQYRRLCVYKYNFFNNMYVVFFFIFFHAAPQSVIVASLFRLNEEEGNTCILLRVDAVIEVKFKTKLGAEDVRVVALVIN